MENFKLQNFHLNVGGIINELDFRDFLSQLRNVKEISLSFDLLTHMQEILYTVLKMAHVETVFIRINGGDDNHFEGLFNES